MPHNYDTRNQTSVKAGLGNDTPLVDQSTAEEQMNEEIENDTHDNTRDLDITSNGNDEDFEDGETGHTPEPLTSLKGFDDNKEGKMRREMNSMDTTSKVQSCLRSTGNVPESSLNLSDKIANNHKFHADRQVSFSQNINLTESNGNTARVSPSQDTYSTASVPSAAKAQNKYDAWMDIPMEHPSNSYTHGPHNTTSTRMHVNNMHNDPREINTHGYNNTTSTRTHTDNMCNDARKTSTNDRLLNTVDSLTAVVTAKSNQGSTSVYGSDTVKVPLNKLNDIDKFPSWKADFISYCDAHGTTNT
jgi:hypothetical protein